MFYFSQYIAVWSMIDSIYVLLQSLQCCMQYDWFNLCSTSVTTVLYAVWLIQFMFYFSHYSAVCSMIDSIYVLLQSLQCCIQYDWFHLCSTSVTTVLCAVWLIQFMFYFSHYSAVCSMIDSIYVLLQSLQCCMQYDWFNLCSTSVTTVLYAVWLIQLMFYFSHYSAVCSMIDSIYVLLQSLQCCMQYDWFNLCSTSVTTVLCAVSLIQFMFYFSHYSAVCSMIDSIYVLLQSLQCCMQYDIILDHVITAPDCISLNRLGHHWVKQWLEPKKHIDWASFVLLLCGYINIIVLSQ